jgi:hypothetical protein
MSRLLLEKCVKVQYFDLFSRGKFNPHACCAVRRDVADHNVDSELYDDLNFRPLYWYAERDDIAAMRAILQHGVEVPWWGLPKVARRNLVAVQLLLNME